MTAPERRGRIARAQAFGIALTLHDDDVEIAGLSPRSAAEGSTPTSVRHDPAGLRERWSGAQPTRTREQRDGEGVLLSVDHDPVRGYLLDAPGVGAALIGEDGLTVHCAPGPDRDDWRAVLVGQVLPLAATVRGLEVFHAAGVALGERSYLLCAGPGVGKTSLAAHLVIGGAALLSDDAVAVDDGLVGHPGCAVLHVREPELQRIDLARVPGLRALETVRGRARFAAERIAGAQPLGGVYLLERRSAGLAIEPVRDASPFTLLGATFNLSVRSPARLAHHLELCAEIAARVPMFRVCITPGRSAADLASLLTAHIENRATSLV